MAIVESVAMFTLNLEKRKEKFISGFRASRKKYISTGLVSIFVFLTIVYLGPFGGLERLGLIGEKKQDLESKAAVIRGNDGDLWADIIIGKPDFSEIVPNTVVANQAYLPHGVVVDRTSTPNKMYVYDAGNNRILGFGLSECLSAATDPLKCSANIVIGQPSMSTSACNGDSGFQNYPTRASVSASSLCGESESQLSISEGGSGASMAVDSQGNLYVFDAWNHRVLKYNKPFETDRVADDVWGQNDFSANSCNKGQSSPDAASLCYTWGDSNNWTAGVDVDLAGNLWVVDNGNNRVLRFPAGSKTADLVLGQKGFASRTFGSGLNELRDPSAVRVASSGSVYVADHFNQRVLVFKPSFSSGMNGRVFGSGFSGPSGVDLDPTEPGRVWITNQGHMTIELWDEGGRKIRVIGARDNGNVLGDASGSIGIDSVGNIFIAIGTGNYDNDVLMFAKGGSATSPAKRIFGWGGSNGNLKTNQGLGWGAGVAVVDNQVIVADFERLMFWNDPTSLTNGKPADGVAGKGVSTFTDRAYGCCLTLKADKNHHLWVSLSLAGDLPSRIEVYQLPLINGAQPIKTLTFNFPVLGGGTISAPSYQSFWGIAPSDTGDFVWLGHADTSRIIRVRDPLTNPVVDAILGQTDLNGTSCNRGAAPITGATASSLCWPGSLSLDKLGNLYVSDSSLEIRGNYRLLEFNKDLLPTDNTLVIYAPAASRIFPDIATWEPAFDSQNHMVVGYNPYHDTNPQHGWFPGVYNNPLASSTSPDALFKDYYSMAFAATFDANDNLYVGDLDRARILIYKNPFNAGVPSPSPSVSATPLISPSPQTSPSPSPPGDIQAPAVSIANPTDGSDVSKTVKISAVASDNSVVVRMEIYIDDAKVASVDNATSVYYDWNTKPKKVLGGIHKISVKALDAAGNTGTATITVNKQKVG